MTAERVVDGGWRSLTTGERLLAAVCLVYPFRILLDMAAQGSLHLGVICFVVLASYVVYSVRERATGFPDALDLAIAGFLGVALLDLLFQGPTRHALKGFSVETRFAVFYWTARFMRIRREFATWLLGATMMLAIVAAVLGIAEFHLKWGALLGAVGGAPDRRFTKLGLARLYSFPMTPVGAAYLFLLALAAAITFTAEGRQRALVAATLLVGWQAMLLTLTRTAFAFACLITLTYALAGGRRGRWFAAGSAGAVGFAMFTFWLRGWAKPLASYAERGALGDASAESHANVISNGYDLIVADPWGYGFGQAGHLAIRTNTVFPRDDTYFVTLGIQMGLPGLAAFAVIVALSGWVWLRMLRNDRAEYRSLGQAGVAIWFALTAGAIYLPTFTMIVPQLYFWLLTAAATNLLHEGDGR